MRIVECTQGSDIWWEARRGLPTASEFDRILTPVKHQSSAAQDGYINQLIGDAKCLLPNWFSDRPVTKDMEHGTNSEPQARAWLEMELGIEGRQVGLCVTDDGRFACSPDLLIEPDGGAEIKCPKMATHVGYLRDGVLPPRYAPQVHGSLIVTGRAYWWFLSYCPGLPPFLTKVVPDDFTKRLRQELERFDEKLKETYLMISRM